MAQLLRLRRRSQPVLVVLFLLLGLADLSRHHCREALVAQLRPVSPVGLLPPAVQGRQYRLLGLVALSRQQAPLRQSPQLVPDLRYHLFLLADP